MLKQKIYENLRFYTLQRCLRTLQEFDPIKREYKMIICFRSPELLRLDVGCSFLPVFLPVWLGVLVVT